MYNTVVASTTSEVNGNYILNFNYNLRSDESYSILLEGDGITSRITEYVSGSNVFYSNFDASTILKGQVNALNINAWKPIKIKFNLTVLNNNTPPLNTNITYNGTSTFGTQQTYTNANTFLIGTRPNSLVNFNF